MQGTCGKDFFKKTLVFIVVPLFPMVTSAFNWPIRRMSNVTGDIMLGALFPIHERNAKYECGRLQDEGLHQLEALLFVLKKINADPRLLPGVKLGVLALDSCDSTAYALEQTLDFIKGFIARNNAYQERQFTCSDGSIPRYRDGSFDRVVGIIGGQSSSVSIQLANLLRLFHVPQVSYQSTSATLSIKEKYAYFFRTVPSDIYQARAILEILKSSVKQMIKHIDQELDQVLFTLECQKHRGDFLKAYYLHKQNMAVLVNISGGGMKYDVINMAAMSFLLRGIETALTSHRAFRWTYVSVVYSDTDYGNKGYEKLQEFAPPEICFSSPQSINVDHVGEADYDTVIKNLMHKTNARVVVVFADKQLAKNLMAAAKRREAINRFVWIGSDAWGGRTNVVEKHEVVVEGAITVSPLVRPLSGFDDHFQSLNPDNNEDDNPWFPEFWEEYFHCRLAGFPGTPYNQEFPKWCSEKKSISESNGYRQTPALHFVRDAAYAFAYALHNMHQSKCDGKPGLCNAMKNIDGQELKKYMEQVNFPDETGKMFRFLPSGDAPPRYSIINFQRVNGNNSYTWKPVGTYSLDEYQEERLVLDKSLMRFKFEQPGFPRSFCSEPCLTGQAKLQLEGDTCCWLCTNCSTFQYLPDEFHCRDCPSGTLPSATKTTCEPIPEAYLTYTNPWAIGVMAFAGLGMATTSVVVLVFWAYSGTPIIKASGRELSYLLLFGIFLSFGMTFVIVARPAPCTCGITRFFLGFCYTLCYAAIVTKTNRIARIFAQRRQKPCQKPRYTSPRSQLVITFLLVSVEVIINTTWLLYDRPAVTHMYPTREENVLICLGSDTASYLVGLIYPFVLIGFCTVYAFKTRKCPDGFNEARYLTFTNYTTCVIWLAFLPLFVLSTSNAIRAVTLSSLLSLSGAVQLACLFMPKVYIALFKPEKNTKESVMCHHNRNSSSLALPSAPTVTASTPSILINGGCKDHHRLSSCSTASPSSIRNSVASPSPAAATHAQELNLFFPDDSREHLPPYRGKSMCFVAPNITTEIPPENVNEPSANIKQEQHKTL